MEVEYGIQRDIESWMRLVKEVRQNFPGLETPQALEEHQQTVLRFMREQRALCIKEQDRIIGVLLLSKTHNMICCLAVDPAHRRKGIASALLKKALSELDSMRDITVTTFRENDEKGTAPRALYKRFGFTEGALLEEFGYPVQEFVLPAEITIRKAEPGDEKLLAYIQTESWKAAFAEILPPEELERCTDPEKAEQMYQNVLQRGDCKIAIEYVRGVPHCIAAWGKNRCGMGDGFGELICIHSLQKQWAKGYGSAMMEYVLSQLQQEGYGSVILWVFEENQRARKFYEKHGFEPTKQKKKANGIWELMYRKGAAEDEVTHPTIAGLGR